ncbi:MAG TPA: HI0074 family nucleotidyltransferase substrate-binding subunit [Candidatus Babeliales bacterium]|jgi:nucleotidyltransferase substrate binding protein (TIGR01987 family)|nr:HI0074 family nucleotidyltransferase substrate-binding subunit [Candidatus Babeliales bacterium]
MEELTLRYQQLTNAYKRLGYMVKKFTQLTNQLVKKQDIDEEDEVIAYRDALIQRFEFCYDLTWKFLKVLLKVHYSIDVVSPRKVIQECYSNEILTDNETSLLLEMIDMRNETSHVYDESKADAVSKRIVHKYQELVNISKKIEQVYSLTLVN